MKSALFVARITMAWGLVLLLAFVLWVTLIQKGPLWIFFPIAIVLFATVTTGAFSHVRRVRLIATGTGEVPLGNRHRRQVEMPFPAGEAFAIVEAAIRELPHVEKVESAPGSLRILAMVKRIDPHLTGKERREREEEGDDDEDGNKVLATVTPGDRTSSLTLVCEPDGGAWKDWFVVDHGTNLENMEAITRAISRRVAEKRKGEEATARDTTTEKELTVAKLSLLHAQVEPHFLYNTLASAQVLTRTDPVKADQMLGHLIVYLRRSLPRAEESMSTLGEELERAGAYLEILKIRMGDRLKLQLQVPAHLGAAPMPPMMLQTLVENAIKHGLEPVPGGGTIWIFARESEGKVSVTVADDGRGFSEDGGGTGIGLKNVRQRLRLLYGDDASFTIVPNYPKGVAATITVPRAAPSAWGEGRR
ncbi:MAG: sensor histidine kinase [Usitatibacter sp.]